MTLPLFTSRAVLASAVSMAAVLALSACAGDPRDRLRPVAKPGEVVAVELAMARASREDGPLEGAEDFAAPGVSASEVAAAAPGVAATQPRLILASCDGTLSVARGDWQGTDGTAGAYSTVWQRQADGDYRWVARSFQGVNSPATADDFIATRVASCDNFAAIPSRTSAAGQAGGQAGGQGTSRDGTLHWQQTAVSDSVSRISVQLWNGTMFENAEQP